MFRNGHVPICPYPDWPHQRLECSSLTGTEELSGGGSYAPSTQVWNSLAPARWANGGRHRLTTHSKDKPVNHAENILYIACHLSRQRHLGIRRISQHLRNIFTARQTQHTSLLNNQNTLYHTSYVSWSVKNHIYIQDVCKIYTLPVCVYSSICLKQIHVGVYVCIMSKMLIHSVLEKSSLTTCTLYSCA